MSLVYARGRRSPIGWMRMWSYFVSPKHKQAWLRPAHLASASLAALIAASDHADAASGRASSGRTERGVASVERAAGEPIMAIVSLRNQRITVYDAKGSILRAPVSSGQRGRE